MRQIVHCLSLALGLSIGVLGFFLPGLFLARILSDRDLFLSSFVISLLILFHIPLLMNALGVPIEFLSVAGALGMITLGSFWLARKHFGVRLCMTRFALPSIPPSILFLSLCACIVVLYKGILNPLPGLDTIFRWNFLAEKILELKHLDFYPPFHAADFRIYFYVDGIPPLISIAYWWIYAALGRVLEPATVVFVLLQFIIILVLSFRITEKLSSPFAAAVALGVVLSSPLIFGGVILGQETGLVTISLCATVYFLLCFEDSKHFGHLILAGMATALGALAREYGLAFLMTGWILGLWFRHSPKSILIYTLTAISLCAS